MNKTKIISIIGVLFLLTCSPIKKAERIIYDSNYELYHSKEKYLIWLDQWRKVQNKGKINNQNLVLLRSEASVAFTDLMSDLESKILQGDETQAKIRSDEIKKYYDQIRYIDSDFDNNQRATNLNDKYLADAGIFAKINLAKSFALQNNYEKWLSTWEELRLPLRETDKIDFFNFQAYIVFNSIINKINVYQQKGEIFNIKNLANNSIIYLRHANRINENFDGYIAKTELKNTVNEEYLKNTEIWAKMDEAQKLVGQKEFVNWYNLWKSIAPLKKNAEKERFKEQSKAVFSYLLSVLVENIQNGNINKTSSIANQTKEIFQGILNNLNSNYQKIISEYTELKDLNFVYLNSANYFSQGYNLFNQKKYKEAVEVIRNSCNYDTIQINKYYVDFIKLVTNQSICDLNDFYSANDIIKESNELANLNYLISNHKNIEFDTPKYLNEGNRNIFIWYENRVNDYIARSSKAIENDIQILNYEKAFDKCQIVSQFCTTSLSVNKIKDYQKKIANIGSKYYLDSVKILQNVNKYEEAQYLINTASKINNEINKNELTINNNNLKGIHFIKKSSDTIIYNKWLIGLDYAIQAKDLLKDNSAAVNKIDYIRRNGELYYKNKFDSCIIAKDWDFANQFCNNLNKLLPNYNISLCIDKAKFEEIITKAQDYYNNGCYRTAKSQAEKSQTLNFSHYDKIRLNNFIADCKNKSTIRVDVLPVFNLTNTSNSSLPFNLKTIQSYARQSVDENKPNEYFECRNIDNIDVILEEFERYLRSHPEVAPQYLRKYKEKEVNKSIDYLIGINILEYEYKYGWEEPNRKTICFYDTKTFERQEPREETEVIWVDKVDANGNKIKKWNSYYEVFENVPEPQTIKKIVNKTVSYFKYKYTEFEYYEKKGNEFLRIQFSISLYDIRKFNTQKNKLSNFNSHCKSYVKYEPINSKIPDFSKLVLCPGSEKIGNWTENAFSPQFNSTEPFNCDSNPFKSAQQIYEDNFKNNVQKLIREQIDLMIDYIVANNKYECN